MENSHIEKPAVFTQSDARLLAKIFRIFNNLFDQVVDDYFSRIDIEFDMQFGKNRNKYDKNDYIAILFYLRSEKDKIKQQYISAIQDNFARFRERCQGKSSAPKQQKVSLTGVALVEEDSVAEDYIIKKIVRVCNESYREQLLDLNRKFAQLCGIHNIPTQENPVSPEVLVQSLDDVLLTLDLDGFQRVALLQVFETNVAMQISFIYRELIEIFKAGKESLNVVKSSDGNQQSLANKNKQASQETDPAKFELLQYRLKNWRERVSPTDFDVVSEGISQTYSTDEIFDALDLLRSFKADEWEKQLLKQHVIAKLVEIDRGVESSTKALSVAHEDTLDLIALVFQSLRQTPTLPKKVNKLLTRLEVPFATIAIMHITFLLDDQHPGRKLLNELYEAGQLLNLDDYSDRLVCDQIERIIDKLNQSQSFETKFIHKLSRGISVYMLKRNRRARDLVERSKQRVRTSEQNELDKNHVESAINNSLEGGDVPEKISTFIDQVWRKVLVLAHSKVEKEPELWTKSVATMEGLVRSVITPENEAQRKDILAMLPDLVTALKEGLIEISFSKPDRSRFFKELAVHHLILMNKDISQTAENMPSKQVSVEAVNEDKLKAPVSEQYRAEALAAELGKWYLFSQGAQPKWGRLLWKSAKMDNMLFIAKNGSTVAELSVDELAEMYSKQQISKVPVDKSEIVYKTFVEILGG